MNTNNSEIVEKTAEILEKAEEIPEKAEEISEKNEEIPKKTQEIPQIKEPDVEIPQPKKRGRPPGTKTKPKVVMQPVEIAKVRPPREYIEPRTVVREPTSHEIHNYLFSLQDRRKQQYFANFHQRVMAMGSG